MVDGRARAERIAIGEANLDVPCLAEALNALAGTIASLRECGC
jgi:hypothetical protein